MKRGNTILSIIGTVGIIIVLFIFGRLPSYAFTEPTEAPTGGNVAAPINISDAAQTKDGALTVTDDLTATRFCLGVDCISAWGDLEDTYVLLAGEAGQPGAAVNLLGTLTTTAQGTQQYAIKGTAADPGAGESYGVYGSSYNSGESYGVFGEATSATSTGSMGIYGSDGGKSNAYAGYFFGRLGIQGELCLGGICKGSFETATGNFVELQNPPGPGYSTVGQGGSLDLEGFGRYGHVVLGDPVQVNPGDLIKSLKVSCGDGVCSSWEQGPPEQCTANGFVEDCAPLP